MRLLISEAMVMNACRALAATRRFADTNKTTANREQ
jgi:hypothetical protein